MEEKDRKIIDQMTMQDYALMIGNSMIVGDNPSMIFAYKMANTIRRSIGQTPIITEEEAAKQDQEQTEAYEEPEPPQKPQPPMQRQMQRQAQPMQKTFQKPSRPTLEIDEQFRRYPKPNRAS